MFDLGRTPVYFGGDEAHFAVVGHSVATTGRNLNGDLLPLFFSLSDPTSDVPRMPWGNTWYQPLLFYLVALVLTVAPLSEFAVRLPVALIGGVVTPVLLYAVAHRLIGKRGPALFAALALALSPSQLILSRQALDYVCPLPFVLGWLWFLIDYTETRRLRSLVFGGLCLGFGFYSYIASWVMMPAYLSLSLLVLWRTDRRLARPLLSLVAGFVIPLLIFVLWVWAHPEMLRETFDRYQMSDQEQVSLIQEPRDALRLDKIAATVSTYWAYFDPAFLFLIGGPVPTTSTGRVGVFLVPLAVLIPLGMLALLRVPDRRGLHALLVIAILLAPVPATLKGQPHMIQRVVFMLPFMALVAAVGMERLWEARWRWARLAAVLLLAAGALQYALFYRDYFTHYKLRSAFYYDPSVVERVSEYVMADTTAPVIYLSVELDDIGAKWRYYTTRDRRGDVMDKTRFVTDDGVGIPEGQAGSLLAIHMKKSQIDALQASGLWTLERVITDVDNREAVAILRQRR